jgi:uncharacterized protein YegL
MQELIEIVQSSARPLPVIILADVSGSMSVDGKIDALNESVREMLKTFSEAEDMRAEIHVEVITFGGENANKHVPLWPVHKIEWRDMDAVGLTPMGQAMKMAKESIEDQNLIPSRAYRPTVILVSDGEPNDEGWEQAMDELIHSGRSAKADRMALAIGDDADVAMLNQFLDDPEKKVHRAEDAGKIKDFFKYVTMSVTYRSRSNNPNLLPAPQDLLLLEEY